MVNVITTMGLPYRPRCVPLTFREIYRDYLDGVLMMKKSRHQHKRMADNCFPGYYDDIIYISRQSAICEKSAVYGYAHRRAFGTVHELLKDHWDRELDGALRSSRGLLEIIRRRRANASSSITSRTALFKPGGQDARIF